MNFGAFAGGLAQGGMSTYLGLSQNKRAQDEQDARNAQRQREDADRELGKQTLGMAGTTKIVANPDTAETEAVGMSVTPTPYSRAQAYEDYSRGVSDPKMGLAYAQLAEQEGNKEKVKGIISAANNWGKDPEGAINQISSIYSGVPDGFQTKPIKMENGGIGVGVMNEKTGQLQVFDASTPQMQNMLTLRALAAVDPGTYMPMFQTAMKSFADDQRGNFQANNTARYQDGQLGVAQQQANQTGLHYENADATAAFGATTQRMSVEQTGKYQDGTLQLYRDGLRGGASGGGARGAAYDPNKAAQAERAARAEAIKAAEGYYTFPDADGKPVKHPAASTLVQSAVMKYGPEGMQQLMEGVRQTAEAQAIDPATGMVDQAKFLPIYNAAVNHALAKVNGAKKAEGEPAQGYKSQPSAAAIQAVKNAKPKPKGTGLAVQMPPNPDKN